MVKTVIRGTDIAITQGNIVYHIATLQGPAEFEDNKKHIPFVATYYNVNNKT